MSTSLEIGRTYTTPYDGNTWPVVLCNELHAPRKFIATRSSSEYLPAILLGKQIYVWVSRQRLVPYLPQKNYLLNTPLNSNLDDDVCDDKLMKLEKCRHKAFLHDALLQQDDAYWAEYINDTKRPRRVNPSGSYKKKETERPCTPLVALHSISDNPNKRKRDPSAHAVDADRLLPPPDNEPLSVFHGRVKLINDCSELLQVRAKNEAWVRSLPKSPDICTIFVGPERKPFQVGINYIKACTALAPKLTSSPETGHTVDISPPADGNASRRRGAIDISIADFLPVFQYMQGDDVITTAPATTNPSAADEAQRLAAHYASAAKLGYVQLQTRVAKRILGLPSAEPGRILAAAPTLLRAPKTGCEAETLLRLWVVQGLSRHIRILTATDGESFWKLLDGSTTLRKEVLQLVIGSSGKICRGLSSLH